MLKQLIVGDSKKPKKKDHSIGANFNKDMNKDGQEKEVNFSVGNFSNVKASNLYHVRVPEQFHKKKYSKLFDYLTTRRYMIPLGLYRTDKV